MDYSASSLAELLNVHTDSVRRWARAGRLPGYKVGKLWRFAREDVEHMRRRTVERSADELADIDVTDCLGTQEEGPARGEDPTDAAGAPHCERQEVAPA